MGGDSRKEGEMHARGGQLQLWRAEGTRRVGRGGPGRGGPTTPAAASLSTPSATVYIFFSS